MGTPDFAVPSLRLLAENHEVVAVYSRPDAVSGRGGATRPSAVSTVAAELNLPILHPATLRDPEVVATLVDLAADVIVVAAYGMILPADVLTAATLGAINVHASVLPRWRGAAPIQRAILAGDERAGVSIMRMEEGLDTGPYCLQASTEVGTLSAEELTGKLAMLGATSLIEALPLIESGTATWITQDESAVTYAEKIRKSDVALDPSLSALEIVRRVRASSPAAPSRTEIAGRGVTVMQAELLAAAEPDADESGRVATTQSVAVDMPTVEPGTVALTRDAVLLGGSDGAVAVTSVKPDGKCEMEATAWARGVRDINGSTWKALS